MSAATRRRNRKAAILLRMDATRLRAFRRNRFDCSARIAASMVALGATFRSERYAFNDYGAVDLMTTLKALRTLARARAGGWE